MDVDALSDVDVLVESEMLVLNDPLSDVLALFESLSLVDVEALSDVDVLVESETFVLNEPLNDVLALLSRSHSLTLMHCLMLTYLLSLKTRTCRFT